MKKESQDLKASIEEANLEKEGITRNLEQDLQSVVDEKDRIIEDLRRDCSEAKEESARLATSFEEKTKEVEDMQVKEQELDQKYKAFQASSRPSAQRQPAFNYYILNDEEGEVDPAY